jgi:molybdopterin-guanine dinucleotide biosynthesis protein A
VRPDGTGAAGAVAGVVLAGGRSRRFGGDKLAARHRGRPLLDHAVVGLSAVCDEVIVVVAPDAPPPAVAGGGVIRVARDAVEGAGPLAGTVAGLEAATTELVVLAGGDMPDLREAVLREMLRAARETGVAAVALGDGGNARPLPCVLRREPALRTARSLLGQGRTSLRDLLAEVALAVVDEPSWTALDPERRTLKDVDIPGDVEP